MKLCPAERREMPQQGDRSLGVDGAPLYNGDNVKRALISEVFACCAPRVQFRLSL